MGHRRDFLVCGSKSDGTLQAPLAIAIFSWLFGIIIWSAFGVVHEAEEVAERLGEPFGTLVLTLAIVVIEVALIAAVMLGSRGVPTLGRDTMFAVLMIVLNGVVGLGLLAGGLRYHQQSYNLQGASAYLAVIIPLTVIALVLPFSPISRPPAPTACCPPSRLSSSRSLRSRSMGYFSGCRPGGTRDFSFPPERRPPTN